MDSGEKKNRIWASAVNAAVLAGTLLVAVVALEGYVRLVADDGLQFDLEMWKYAKSLKRESGDPLRGHEHIPQSSAYLMGADVAINAFGHRDDLQQLKKPMDVRRIIMLGDSLTFGWGVSQHDTTSELLQTALNRRKDGWNYEVINTGVGNTNTDMQVRGFEAHGHRFEPDLVILNYFINDPEPTPHRKTSFLAEKSYAYVYAAGRLDLLRRKLGETPDWQDYYASLYAETEPGWRAARQAIERLATWCRIHGVPLIVASYPELHQVAPYPFIYVNERLGPVVMENGGVFIDLLPALDGTKPETLWVHPMDAHPNALANRRFTEHLLPLVTDTLAGP